MIYFLVNNNYHVNLDLKLAKELTNYKLGLIQVPYSLEVIKISDIFSDIYTYDQRLITSFKNILFKPKNILNIFRKVDNSLSINQTDILFVHTDMDLLNQYIIQKFYRYGADVYLLEDGIGTITQFNMKEEPAEWIERLRCLLLKHIYKLKYLRIIKYGGICQSIMEDFIFKGVVLNHGDSIKRKIQVFNLTPNENQITVMYEKGAIFFNQPLYLFYLSEDDFFDYLEDLLSFSYNFSPFYFKFHPSDTESFKLLIYKLIKSKFHNIKIILENDIAEDIIYKYPVRYAITISSSSSFNLINKGIIPIFLNEMFNSKYPNKAFDTFSIFSESINCYTPKNIEEIKPGFIAFKKNNNNTRKFSLFDIINGER